MTDVVLWEDSGFKGDKLELDHEDKHLGNNIHFDGLKPDTWNDEASSIKITGGRATFYTDVLFEGKGVTLEPGSYDLDRMTKMGIANDSISSVQFA